VWFVCSLQNTVYTPKEHITNWLGFWAALFTLLVASVSENPLLFISRNCPIALSLLEAQEHHARDATAS
jgi:hypothetical protein